MSSSANKARYSSDCVVGSLLFGTSRVSETGIYLRLLVRFGGAFVEATAYWSIVKLGVSFALALYSSIETLLIGLHWSISACSRSRFGQY